LFLYYLSGNLSGLLVLKVYILTRKEIMMTLKQQFFDAVTKVKERQQQGFRIYADWYESGQHHVPTFTVELCSAQLVERKDGWHLIGFDRYGKEYCLGNAVISSTTVSSSSLELYRPENLKQ
jgi:hypothetical protein